MSDFLKISIVTVNFNGGAFLERTIKSVLDQGYPNLEYVIIDGGSTDNSIEIIRKYESHLHYWVSEPDRGMYHALHKGFEKTSGEIMGWLNSDDLYHGKGLFQVAAIFSRYEQIRWLTGVPTAIDEEDNIMVPKTDRYPVWSKVRFYAGDYKWVQQESTLWRRDLWVKSGGISSHLKYAGDFNLWLSFFKFEKLYAAPILIGAFRIRKEGQQSIEHLDEYLEEVRRTYRERTPFLAFLLAPFSFLDRAAISIPYLNKIYYLSGIRRLFGYPSKLEFDGKTQKIILK